MESQKETKEEEIVRKIEKDLERKALETKLEGVETKEIDGLAMLNKNSNRAHYSDTKEEDSVPTLNKTNSTYYSTYGEVSTERKIIGEDNIKEKTENGDYIMKESKIIIEEKIEIDNINIEMGDMPSINKKESTTSVYYSLSELESETRKTTRSSLNNVDIVNPISQMIDKGSTSERVTSGERFDSSKLRFHLESRSISEEIHISDDSLDDSRIRARAASHPLVLDPNQDIFRPDKGSPLDLALRSIAPDSTEAGELSPVTKGTPIKQKTQGASIEKDHELYHLTYGMMCGIRTTVSMTNQEQDKLIEFDFVQVDKYLFPPSGSMHGGAGGKPTPPHHLPFTFKFKDYASRVFRQLRGRFGIDPSDYLCDLCGDFNYIEFISNSKSGQFFFYSYNGKLMIKTQTNAESKFLRRILPRYYMYVMKNPNTLLTRFYGMHRVKMDHLRHRKMHFVIMHSVFDTDKVIHRMYDLKGSHIGRAASEEDLKRINPVLKDCDLEGNSENISLGKDRKKVFMDQIRKDSKFLASLKIMDYSLLIGIHKHKSNNEHIIKTTSVTLTENARIAISETRSPKGSMNHNKVFSNSSLLKTTTDVLAGNSEVEEKTVDRDDPEYIRAMLAIQRETEKIANKTLSHVPIFTTEDGGVYGMTSTGEWNEEIYFMGIIDILQLYNARKQIETLGKTWFFRHDKKEISSVHPNFYAERFCAFLEKNSS